MTDPDGGVRPFFDQSVLDRLREELDDDDGVWTMFVDTYITLLPQRTEKLRLALTTGDLPGALDAVLSLKTSSQMVGAERLAGFALALEEDLRSETSMHDPARILPQLAAAQYRPIVLCARQTTYLLRDFLRIRPADDA